MCVLTDGSIEHTQTRTRARAHTHSLSHTHTHTHAHSHLGASLREEERFRCPTCPLACPLPVVTPFAAPVRGARADLTQKSLDSLGQTHDPAPLCHVGLVPLHCLHHPFYPRVSGTGPCHAGIAGAGPCSGSGPRGSGPLHAWCAPMLAWPSVSWVSGDVCVCVRESVCVCVSE